MRRSHPKLGAHAAEGFGHWGPPAGNSRELWLALGRRRWGSVVLVPADVGGSAAAAAHGLAEVGKERNDLPVTLFVIEDPGSGDPRSSAAGGGASGAFDYSAVVQFVTVAAARPHDAVEPAPGKVIVAIESVIAQPLGLSVTRAVDVVVLHVEVGVTRLASAQRTVELVGRERVAGCLVEPARGRSGERR